MGGALRAAKLTERATMKPPWQAGMVIKINYPFHELCLRLKFKGGKHWVLI